MQACGYTPEAPMRIVPSADAITRMEECFDWLLILEPEDGARRDRVDPDIAQALDVAPLGKGDQAFELAAKPGVGRRGKVWGHRQGAGLGGVHGGGCLGPAALCIGGLGGGGGVWRARLAGFDRIRCHHVPGAALEGGFQDRLGPAKGFEVERPVEDLGGGGGIAEGLGEGLGQALDGLRGGCKASARLPVDQHGQLGEVGGGEVGHGSGSFQAFLIWAERPSAVTA
jgi:hypothetical protein